MTCPFCGVNDDLVIDSTPTSRHLVITRRRECQCCGKRFTTHETIEEVIHRGRPRSDDSDRTDPASLRVHDLPRRLQAFTKGSA